LFPLAKVLLFSPTLPMSNRYHVGNSITFLCYIPWPKFYNLGKFDENTLRTWWEHIGNNKNPTPSSLRKKVLNFWCTSQLFNKNHKFSDHGIWTWSSNEWKSLLQKKSNF
jgi:hypothetical protein